MTCFYEEGNTPAKEAIRNGDLKFVSIWTSNMLEGRRYTGEMRAKKGPGYFASGWKYSRYIATANTYIES